MGGGLHAGGHGQCGQMRLTRTGILWSSDEEMELGLGLD